jgi:hypothetical protein
MLRAQLSIEKKQLDPNNRDRGFGCHLLLQRVNYILIVFEFHSLPMLFIRIHLQNDGMRDNDIKQMVGILSCLMNVYSIGSECNSNTKRKHS